MKKIKFRQKFDGAQDFDLVLQAYLNKNKNEQIGHVKKVLYHWRCHEYSTASNPRSKQYAYEAGKEAVQEFLQNSKMDGATVNHMKHNGFYRINYGNVNENPKLFFEKRKDAGILAGPIYKKKKITGGIYNDDGVCPYAGLRKGFGGYLHRAVLQQDADIIDIRNMMVNPDLINEVSRIIVMEAQKYVESSVNRDRGNKKAVSLSVIEQPDAEAKEEAQLQKNLLDAINMIVKYLNNDSLAKINKAVSEHVREKGYLLIWDPQFKKL